MSIHSSNFVFRFVGEGNIANRQKQGRQAGRGRVATWQANASIHI